MLQRLKYKKRVSKGAYFSFYSCLPELFEKNIFICVLKQNAINTYNFLWLRR